MKTSLKQKLNLTTKTTRQRLALVAVSIGVLGALIVLITRAASTPAVLEAETAAVTGNARPVEDIQASNGKALRFGQASTTPNPGGNSNTGAYQFPLKVSGNGRHLVDQGGRAFLVVADTAWTMMPYLSVADAKKLIDMRKAQGFNTILTNLVGWDRDVSGPNGVPFESGDVTHPVESYWQAVDQIMNYAKTQDMLLCIGPMPTGNNKNMDTSAMTAYGTWIGQRYKSQGNLIWYVGHDSSPGQDYASNNAEAAAIKAQIPGALISYHMVGLAWPWDNNAPNESWYGYYAMQWNGVGSPFAYDVIGRMYDRSPTRPAFNIEPAYEPNNADPHGRSTTSPLDVRSQAWWSVLAGAMGVTYGGPPGAWNIGAESPPNWSDIERPAASQVGTISRLLSPLPWSLLVPDRDKTIVTGGRGTAGGSDYVTAGGASDGSLIVAYAPSSRTLEVNLSKLSGGGTAQWYDPVSGQASGNSEPVSNSGTKSFTTPGNNSGGDSDWVLIIKRVN